MHSIRAGLKYNLIKIWALPTTAQNEKPLDQALEHGPCAPATLPGSITATSRSISRADLARWGTHVPHSPPSGCGHQLWLMHRLAHTAKPMLHTGTSTTEAAAPLGCEVRFTVGCTRCEGGLYCTPKKRAMSMKFSPPTMLLANLITIVVP